MSKVKKRNTQSLIPLPVKIYSPNGIWDRFVQLCLQIYYSIRKNPAPKCTGTFMSFGGFVWIHNRASINELYSSGVFGKGDLSRSEPTWFNRTLEQNKNALENITIDRRNKRRQKKKGNDNKAESNDSNSIEDSIQHTDLLALTKNEDVETFQLDTHEAFFLLYAVNALQVHTADQKILSIQECWSLFHQNSPTFHLNYAVYHFYRSLGWVPKCGSKFGVDFVLYESGPRYRHADYAVVVIPLYSNKIQEQKTWDWLLRLNRICNQVKKTLLLCHVTIPQDTSSYLNLNEYQIRQVIYKRWSPQKNRE